MPKSKDPAAYPYRYAQLFHKINEEGEVTLHLENNQQAQKLRFDLYAFRTAVRANPEGYEGIQAIMPSIKFIVDGNRIFCFSVDRVSSPEAQAIDRVLGEALEGVTNHQGESSEDDAAPDLSTHLKRGG